MFKRLSPEKSLLASRADILGTIIIVGLILLCVTVIWARRQPVCPQSASEDHLRGNRSEKGEDAARPSAELTEEDWPHLRGRRYDGVSREKGLIDSWPEKGPTVNWRIPLGQGYSGFVAVAGVLYTMEQDRTGQYVVALNARTGDALWRYRHNWPWDPDGDYPGPRATPTWYKGKIYSADAYGLVSCLDARNGRLLWSINVTETFGGQGTEFGYSCTPLVIDGKVIMPVGGEKAAVVALDAEDGTVVWRGGSGRASYCGAVPVTLAGQQQAICFLQNSVISLDRETGRQIWGHELFEGYDEHAAWPLYEEPCLLLASPFRSGTTVFELRSGQNGTEAVLLWRSEGLSNDILSSLVRDGYVYGFDLQDLQANPKSPSRGEFKCLRLKTGEVVWSTGRTGHATVIAAEAKLLLLNESGELILAREAAERYEEIGRRKVFDTWPCWTSPTLHQGNLFLRNSYEAACIRMRKDEVAGAGLTAATGAPRSSTSDPRVGPAHHGPWVSRVFTGESLFAPDLKDISLWYLFSVLGVWAPSAIAAAFLHAVFRRLGRTLTPSRVFFVARIMMMFLGAVGLVFLSLLAGAFIFTWPAVLFAAFLCLVTLILSQDGKPDKRPALPVPVSVVLFLGFCALYVYGCQHFFISAGWGFLVGLLPAWPLSVYAARKALEGDGIAKVLFWDWLAFSVYFWLSGIFTIWKTHL